MVALKSIPSEFIDNDDESLTFRVMQRGRRRRVVFCICVPTALKCTPKD